MQVGQRQDLRQSQSLVMTPQLQQAIKLLQLTNLEVAEFIEQELENNPLLERQEGERAERGERDPEASESETSAAATEADASTTLSEHETIPAANDAPLDVSERDTYGDGDGEVVSAPVDTGPTDYAAPTGGSSSFDNSVNILEQTVSGDISLYDHLLSQLNMDFSDPVERLIGYHLIHMVDDSGYLPADVGQIAEQIGTDPEMIEATVQKLQRFDPPGVFARDLKECLSIQLRELDRLDPAMQALMDNLDLLARLDHETLMTKCGVDADDLTDMIAEIRALDPKPGLAFNHEIAQAVVPDVFVRPASGGNWTVELNNETLPRVLVNQQYYAQVSKKPSASDDKAYISEKLNSANWLVRSLEQRANTILKVATELVRQQEAFFAKGVQHLKPLTLRDIAAAIEMHESTVSRVTANKFLATPRGIYQMKYFFTSAIPSASGGEAHSAESVRHRIKELIDEEDPKKVLSDDKIVELLASENIDIARRTVAKYREALRIPSSVARRREKKAAAWNSR